MKHAWKKLAAMAAGLTAFGSGTALAQDPFLGEIRWVGFNFCPRGWAEADGQILPISNNSALFALFGTIYGGDGRTTFALPDLRGRVMVHEGQGPGLSDFRQGQRAGSEEVTLSEAQLPAHDHDLKATSSRGNTANPSGAALADGRTARVYSSSASSLTSTMQAGSVANAGASQPHDNMPPYLVLKACVATVGVFPSRS